MHLHHRRRAAQTNSWRYPLLMVAYLFGLAYAASFVTYRITLAPGRWRVMWQQWITGFDRGAGRRLHGVALAARRAA